MVMARRKLAQEGSVGSSDERQGNQESTASSELTARLKQQSDRLTKVNNPSYSHLVKQTWLLLCFADNDS